MRDVVVLVPGLMGSALAKAGRPIWDFALAAYAGIGSLARNLRLVDHRLDVDLADDVRATSLLPTAIAFPGLPPIDGYTEIAQTFREGVGLELGVDYFEFPYDWRRDVRASARLLKESADGWLEARRRTEPDARLVLVAHSLGGLVCRHFLLDFGGLAETRRFYPIGAPFSGAVNALDALSNGVRKFRILDLTTAVRSFDSLYQLLPSFACYDRGKGDLEIVGALRDVPHVDPDRAAEALEFHERSEARAREQQLASVTRPIVGLAHPTVRTARLQGAGVAVDAMDEGDGTVLRTSASAVKGEPLYSYTKHGSLQKSEVTRANLHGVLTDRAMAPELAVIEVPDVRSDGAYSSDEPVRLDVASPVDVELRVEAVEAAGDQTHEARPLPRGKHTIDLGRLAVGVYRLTLRGGREDVHEVFQVIAEGAG